MKVMVTGHRPSRIKGSEEKIINWLKTQLSELNNIEECISGCCRGVDRLFTDVVIEKGLPLLCAFPIKHELNSLEKENVELKEYYQKKLKDEENAINRIVELTKENTKLKAHCKAVDEVNEKMKCGGNCKHSYSVNTGGCYDTKCELTGCDCINCKDKWELGE